MTLPASPSPSLERERPPKGEDSFPSPVFFSHPFFNRPSGPQSLCNRTRSLAAAFVCKRTDPARVRLLCVINLRNKTHLLLFITLNVHHAYTIFHNSVRTRSRHIWPLFVYTHTYIYTFVSKTRTCIVFVLRLLCVSAKHIFSVFFLLPRK